MRKIRSTLVGVIVSLSWVVGLTGCFGLNQVSPSVVTRGSVIYVPIGPDGFAGTSALSDPGYFLQPMGKIGYGGKFLAEHAGRYDLQRGWLVFRLENPNLATPIELTTLAVTRMHADPASIATQNGSQGFPSLSTPHGTGYAAYNSVPEWLDAFGPWPYTSQIVAIVEIPNNIPIEQFPDGDYSLRLRNRVGTTSGITPCTVGSPGCIENEVDFLSAVTVEGSVTDFRPTVDSAAFETAGTFGEPPEPPTRIYHAKDGLMDLYPDPKITFELPKTNGVYPAAAHIEVSYPSAMVSEIRSVFEEQHSGRDSVVLWSVPQPGTLLIDLLDPTQSVRWLSFSFDPTTAQDIVSNLSISEQTYFDANGNPIPSAVLAIEPDVR